jgi:hypothetical protein
MKHIEKAPSLLDLKNNLSIIYNKQLTTDINNILKLISAEYSIPLEELENKFMNQYYKQVNTKPITNDKKSGAIKCKAKIHNGNQCSRNCFDGSYCKKHLKNRSYGEIPGSPK